MKLYPCSIRKIPTVFEHGDNHYFIMWETSCLIDSLKIQWWSNISDPSQHNIIDPANKKINHIHYRYTAILGPVAEDAKKIYYKVDNQELGRNAFTITRQRKLESTSLLVISDNQNGPDEFKKVLNGIKNYYNRSKGPNALLHVGDSEQNVDELSEWHNQFFDPMKKYAPGMLQTLPLIFVPGNYDHDKDRTVNNFNYYTDMYHGLNNTNALSKDIVVSGKYHRFYHSVTMGCARMIVLDAECPSPEQSEFLKQELQSDAFQNARFRIIAVHIAPYIEFWDPDAWNRGGQKHWGEQVRLEYDPLFRKYNVDLVISGHQHNYQRSTIAIDGNSNITYAIVGGAGGTLGLVRVEDYHMYNVTYLNHHFVTLDIDQQRLEWKAWSPENKLIDQFHISR